MYNGRRSYGSTVLYRVPTPAEMNGDLSRENPIYDPFSTRLDPERRDVLLRDPFPGARIPKSRIDPIAMRYVSIAYPAPVDTGFAGTNGINPKPSLTNQDMWTIRGDHQTGAESFSFRYTAIRTPVTTAGDGGLAGSSFRRSRTATIWA